MGTFVEGIRDGVKSSICSLLGSATTGAEMVNESLGFSLPTIAPAVRALRRQICDNDDDSVTLPSPPFTGGQCACGRYEVSIEYTRLAFDGTPIPGQRTNRWLRGPIGRPSVSISGNGRTLFWSIPCRGGSSSQSNLPSCTSEVIDYQWNQSVSTATGIQDIQLTIIQALDGDDCGSLPSPEPAPYNPSPITVNISYENNQQITVNEDVDITIFAPQVNLIGGIFAPITIAGNTFNLVGTVELTPNFEVNLSPEIDVSFGGGSSDNPPPEPDRPYPEPTPPSNERRVIVGAIVTATDVANRQDFLPQDENPDIGVPNLGYVAFYIATENARAWTSDIPVKNVRSYIACPVASGAVDVAGTGRSGITIQVEPVWGYPGQQV